MIEARQYQRQINRIVAKWAARRETEGLDELAKQNRWPGGAPGSKGGQFAPEKTGGGSGGGSKYPGGGKAMKGEGGSGALSSYASMFGSGSKFPGSDSPSWAAIEAAQGEPKGPPPGAKPHPHVNDKGQPVTINYPSKPSDQGSWTDGSRTATFTPGSATPAALHGIPLKPWAAAPRSDSEWANVPGQDQRIDDAHPFTPTEGKSVGAGVIVKEPDGRIWLTAPTNSFGGYRNTFPKGTVEHGLTMQASAIKEAYEETGLQIRITGVLGDYERTTSKARFYIAERVSGTPAAMGWESQAIRLATAKDAAKLLNMGVDKGILTDLTDEGFFEKATRVVKAGGWKKQDRWPGGTPLGGQWKTMDANGMTVPPTVAGGLTGTNPQYQKKMNAAYSAAQAGAKKDVLDLAIVTAAKVKEAEQKGTKNGHSKNTAMVSQYLTELAANLFAMPKLQAIAERILGWLKLSSWTFLKPKTEGSNPGGVYKDDKGNEWLVKGNASASATGGKVSDERAQNEVLAAKLMLAAGVGAPEMKIVDLEGKHGSKASGPGSLGVASKLVDGVKKFDLNNPAHIAAAQADFAVHAWLGNWDVLGAAMDNTMIGKDGKAVCIDPGGSILFRAQGEKKTAGQFDASAADFETMRKSNHYQQAVYGSMTKSQLADSAAKLAGMTDDMIRELVKSYGTKGDEAAQKLMADTLIARRDAILAKAGVMKSGTIADKPAAPAMGVDKPVDTPPTVKAASTPAAPIPGLNAPTFDNSFNKATYYSGVANAMLAAHAAGDMAALKALSFTKKGASVFATKTDGNYTINGGLMKPFYDKLVADLEAKKGEATQALDAGKATITGTDGKTWVSDGKGVLQPTAQPAPGLPPAALSKAEVHAVMTLAFGEGKKPPATDTVPITYMLAGALKGDTDPITATYGLKTKGGEKLKALLLETMQNKAAAVAAAVAAAAPAVTAPAPATAAPTAAPSTTALTQDKISQIIAQHGFKLNDEEDIPGAADAGFGASTGNVSAVSSWQPSTQAGKKVKADLLSAMNDTFLSNLGASISAPGGVVPAPAPAAAAAPAPAAPAKASPIKVSDTTLQAMMDDVAESEKLGPMKLSAIDPTGPTGKLIAAAKAGDIDGVVNAKGAGTYFTGLQDKLIQAFSTSVPSAPAAPAPSKPTLQADQVNAILGAASYFPMDKLSQDGPLYAMAQAAMAGDVEALKAVPPFYPKHTEIKEQMISALGGRTGSAPSKPVIATPQPVPQPAPKVPTAAAPNFDALKMTDTTNAAVFNSKLAAIKAAFETGDENAILAMKFGINTTSKKAAKVANDALAALGSVHKVAPGQADNAHPALTGGTAQAPTAAPKPTADPFKPKAPADLSDTSWVKLSANEKIVGIKEEFGVKSATIEVAAKGYDPSAFGAPPDFFTNGSQGETGKWSSSKKEVNEANNTAVKEIFDTATNNGTPEKLKAMKFPLVVNGAVQMVDIADHKAAGVKEYHNATVAELEAQLKPTYKTQTSGSMTGSYSAAAQSVAADFKTKSYPEFKAHTEKAADYLILSHNAAASVPVPVAGQFKETGPAKADFKAFRAASKAAYGSLTSAEQSAAKSYTGSSYDTWNYQLRTGQFDALSSGGKSMVKAFEKAAQDIPEGSILWRGLDVGLDTYQSVVGGLIQDGSFNSASYGSRPAPPFSSKQTFLRIHVTKGVKAMDATVFSNFGSQESEVIIQNNVRYMVLKAEHHKNFVDSAGYSHGSKNIIDVIAIPHDA